MKNIIKIVINKFLKLFGLLVINQNQKIIEISDNDNELLKTISIYSMTPKIRMYNLLQSLREIKYKNIPGDFVECGVWNG